MIVSHVLEMKKNCRDPEQERAARLKIAPQALLDRPRFHGVHFLNRVVTEDTDSEAGVHSQGFLVQTASADVLSPTIIAICFPIVELQL